MTSRNRDIPSFAYWVVKSVRDWLSDKIGAILAVISMIMLVISFMALTFGLMFGYVQAQTWGIVGTVTFGLLFTYLLYLKEHDLIDM